MPLNPPAPPPPKKEMAVQVTKAAIKRNHDAIEVTALGIALGLLILLTGAPFNLALGLSLVFVFGAVVESIIKGGK